MFYNAGVIYGVKNDVMSGRCRAQMFRKKKKPIWKGKTNRKVTTKNVKINITSCFKSIKYDLEKKSFAVIDH